MGRECGWTRADVAEFTPRQLMEITEEVYYQKQQDWWENNYSIAQLASLTANMHRKKGSKTFKPQDFIGKRPKKRSQAVKKDLASLVAEAKVKGLKVPGLDI